MKNSWFNYSADSLIIATLNSGVSYEPAYDPRTWRKLSLLYKGFWRKSEAFSIFGSWWNWQHTLDLGSSAVRRESSSLSEPTSIWDIGKMVHTPDRHSEGRKFESCTPR